MKTILLLSLTFFSGALFACNDQLFRLALNQRSFYNPAALCPYCKGSTFMSAGLNFMPGTKNGFGYYYAFGNDEENLVHGPWDVSYSLSRTPENRTSAFSLRYAWAMQFGNWRAAVGMRGSYYKISETFAVPGGEDAHVNTRLFDSDAGVMLTNQKGFYVGASLLHLAAPQKTLHSESGFTHSVEMLRSTNVMAGYVQKLNKNWDLLPDVSWMNNKNESYTEAGTLIRYKHHYTIGGGVTFASDEKAGYEIRAGYMSSKFKWMASACPSTEGWNIETGIVWRFWFTQECDGGTCSSKPKPWKRADDFIRHR